MIRAFIYLQVRTGVNRLFSRLKRLRQPKYLVGGIVGGLYLYFYFFRYFLFGARSTDPSISFSADLVEAVAASILLAVILLAWILPHARTALQFSEAEIAFLFPAPVTRRALIHYKLVRSQTAILFTTLLLALLTGRWIAQGDGWMRVLGWWVVLSALNLHFLAASFTRTLLLDRGVSNWARRICVLLIAAAMIALTWWWARDTFVAPPADIFSQPQELKRYIVSLAATPPLSLFLIPLKWMLGPFLASTPEAFVRAIGPAIFVLALHYFWVLRCNVSFEEASVDASRRTAERLAAHRAGHRSTEFGPRRPTRALFVLAPTGSPAIALLWKSLIHARSSLNPRTLLLIIFPVVIMGLVFGSERMQGNVLLLTLTFVSGLLLLWSLLIGGQMARFDFRQDFVVIDVLKTYPMRGWQMALGEILGPATVLTAVQWTLSVMTFVLAANSEGEWRFSWTRTLPFVLSAMFLMPFWNCISLLVPNAALLAYPGWFQIRPDAPHGIEVMGQRLLMVMGQMLVTMAALIPAAALFAAAFIPAQILGLPLPGLIVGCGFAAAVMVVEIGIGIRLLGNLFDRLDLSAEQTF